ncbi:MAG: PhnD/SsuA/transferrin family substrate-binding protein [Desulfurivibrio sp.]|nr:PhnD/SsuA/transferrin family substrate-binding protein [Desulfurivibrio sp.]
MRKIIVLLAFFLLLPLAPGRVAAEPPLRFALPPYVNPARLYESFTPLARSLAAATGREVRLVLSPNYISLIRKLGRGEADIAFVGPSPYVKVKDAYHSIELLARLDMQDQTNDKVVLISRRDSGINSPAELAGRTFAFGDYHSFGSHFMSRFILNEHGVPPARLLAYDYVGSHDNVALGVRHGDFEAGGLRLDIFNRYRDEDLRIIHGPVAIPPHALVCRSSLPKESKRQLRRHLLALDDAAILQAVDPALLGFAPVADRDFDSARRIIGRIEAH